VAVDDDGIRGGRRDGLGGDQREELPQGLSIHETSTIATVWPASPCFNNLVYFVPHHSLDSYGRMQEVWLDR
jgi:hypothetical protein